MGMAPVAHVMFNKFMNFNPKNPDWLNRDRFVLSYVGPIFSLNFRVEATSHTYVPISTGTAMDACFSMLSYISSATKCRWTISKPFEYVVSFIMPIVSIVAAGLIPCYRQWIASPLVTQKLKIHLVLKSLLVRSVRVLQTLSALPLHKPIQLPNSISPASTWSTTIPLLSLEMVALWRVLLVKPRVLLVTCS